MDGPCVLYLIYFLDCQGFHLPLSEILPSIASFQSVVYPIYEERLNSLPCPCTFGYIGGSAMNLFNPNYLL
jgi:hypothetical protein